MRWLLALFAATLVAVAPAVARAVACIDAGHHIAHVAVVAPVMSESHTDGAHDLHGLGHHSSYQHEGSPGAGDSPAKGPFDCPHGSAGPCLCMNAGPPALLLMAPLAPEPALLADTAWPRTDELGSLTLEPPVPPPRG